MQRKSRLLIIEDEQAILTGLMDLFVYHGYDVDVAQDGQLGLEKALQGTYDLIILDIMLPRLDGFAICDAIRHHSREQPLIILTAKTTDEDIITGLTLGADDYVAKPFSVRELVLRVEAVLRRSAKRRYEAAQLCLGTHLQIDTRTLVGTQRDHPEPLLLPGVRWRSCSISPSITIGRCHARNSWWRCGAIPTARTLKPAPWISTWPSSVGRSNPTPKLPPG